MFQEERIRRTRRVLGGCTPLSAQNRKTVPLGYGMERYYAEYFRFVAKKLASFVPKERKNALFAFLLGALHRFGAVQSHKLGSKTKTVPLGYGFCFGADYGARTRHLHLGKVALYQMS